MGSPADTPGRRGDGSQAAVVGGAARRGAQGVVGVAQARALGAITGDGERTGACTLNRLGIRLARDAQQRIVILFQHG